MLSFVTTSEMAISTVTVARSRPACGEIKRTRAASNDTATDIVCFAAFVIPIFLAPMANGVSQLNPLTTKVNYERE